MKKIAETLQNWLFFAVAGYFGFWADFVLRKWQPTTIVVTGSSGKTTLINMLAYQFGHKALVSLKYNSTFGIPFHILGLEGTDGNIWRWPLNILLAPFKAFTTKHSEKYYIAEADASMPGEGKFLAKLLKPSFTVWVSSARTHSMHFDRLIEKDLFDTVDQAIAAEYSYFAEYTKHSLFADGDNTDIAEAIEDYAPDLEIESNQQSVTQYSVDTAKTSFMLSNKRIYRFKGPQPRRIGYQVSMMDKLLQELDISPKLEMKGMKQPPGRSSIFQGLHKTFLLDSTYNANLDSMSTILELFSDIEVQTAGKILVLGDMLEQGSVAPEEHRRLAHLIASSKDNYLAIILLGPHMKAHTQAELAKLTHAPIFAFDETKEVLEHLQSTLKGGEFIMFKGSAGQLLEGVVQHLLADKRNAKHLPRQTDLWAQRRAKKGL